MIFKAHILTSLIFLSTAINNPVAIAQTESKDSTTLVPQFVGKKTGVEISKATAAEITSENYPDIIESFVFPNADLKDVIKAMSTDLNINIIMSPEIANKKISIISYSPITVAEAYQAFLSALAVHNLTMIRSGSFFKIITSDQALKSNSSVYTSPKALRNDLFVTRIFKLKYINVATLEAKIKPLIENKSVKSFIAYEPSNMLIISDYGLNLEKIRKIIQALDVPSQDNIFKVIPIKHAQAKDLEKILSSLLNVSVSTRRSSRFRTGKATKIITDKIDVQSLQADERTNSIIVLGNTEGLNKVEDLIKQLDTYKDPDLAGGIFVYKVKHGTAKDLATTLNEVMGNTSKNPAQTAKAAAQNVDSRRAFLLPRMADMATAQAFKDIRIIAEENTNTLIIVANKFDYNHTILNILKAVDISRNQVFVKAIIMEMHTDHTNEWKVSTYYFPEEKSGIPRIGYGMDSLSDFLTQTGTTLMFPLRLLSTSLDMGNTDISDWISGGTTALLNSQSKNNKETQVNNSQLLSFPSLSTFINFLQKTIGGNIVSTPQVIALDHQKATISIIEEIPVIGSKATLANQTINNASVLNQVTSKEKIETSLEITPHINPDVNSVRLEIKQIIDNIKKGSDIPSELINSSIGKKTRQINTHITLKNKETAVLGGMVSINNSQEKIKVPILGDLPLIGRFFRNSIITKKKTNLIVFITPHIIRSAEEHKYILSDKLKERMKFIRQFTYKDPFPDITKQMISPDVNLKSNTKEQPPQTPVDIEQEQSLEKPAEEESILYDDEDDGFTEEDDGFTEEDDGFTEEDTDSEENTDEETDSASSFTEINDDESPTSNELDSGESLFPTSNTTSSEELPLSNEPEMSEISSPIENETNTDETQENPALPPTEKEAPSELPFSEDW